MSDEGSDPEIKHGDDSEVEHLRVAVSLVCDKEERVREAKRIMYRQHDEERKQKQEANPVGMNEGSRGYTVEFGSQYHRISLLPSSFMALRKPSANSCLVNWRKTI